MKKYLMTGIAVVAMCAAFTSCSKDKEMFDPDFGEKTAEARYEAAFVSRFGEIASNQDWGFGQFKYKANARTRAIDVNGNMWEDCPTVADFEEQAVWNWVKTHNLNKVNPSGLTDYFVTQIHKGTDTYTNNDGGNVGTGRPAAVCPCTKQGSVCAHFHGASVLPHREAPKAKEVVCHSAKIGILFDSDKDFRL